MELMKSVELLLLVLFFLMALSVINFFGPFDGDMSSILISFPGDFMLMGTCSYGL